ncbi:MAG: hypothetical protein CL662_14175 [Bacteroidetes bacterium]|jgi:Tfp pilus assembly protein PilE|nr:hypothetical protein [Bacteroidota bacterium]MAC04211.1 hypothetical protein [Balneola sp.]MAO78226.1 hypothetical protein [Balneola sp.]MBF64227.1 hypothetical protein [Balneola sp.]HAW80025.1 hypothetical protein [Balneola sp.]|tara:strand:- start:4512 stop:4967 length:456 start_codon:yes stop_codon:yes gene_type:complete
MGQQQLLLVILVTIIVGIATVVAINTFSSAADSANLDAVRQDVANIAASAQGYYMKPTQLGGGGQSFASVTFNNISFASDTIAQTGFLSAVNANGKYVISAAGATSFVITAHPASDPDYDASTLATAMGSTAGNTMSATATRDDLTWTDSN